MGLIWDLFIQLYAEKDPVQMGNNKPDDEEGDLFLSLLSYEGDMLDMLGHMGIAHDAPCVSHGTGKAEWLLYFTASSESILTKIVTKPLHIGSFLIAALKSCQGTCFSHSSGGSHQYCTGPYPEATVQSSDNPTDMLSLLYKPKRLLTSLDQAVLH